MDLIPTFVTTIVHPRRKRTRQFTAPITCTQRHSPIAQAANVKPPNSVIPPVVFVLGGPGSGKGTQCTLLQRDFDIAQICVGDLLRREAASGTRLGQQVADVMQRGEIVPGDITMRLLKSALEEKDACKAVLIDGFPRAMDQAQAFEQVVTTCSFVLFCRCDQEEMVKRLLKRGETSGRADDTHDVIRKRLKTYMAKTMPVVEHYQQRNLLREIDTGAGSPEDVYIQTKLIFDDAFSC